VARRVAAYRLARRGTSTHRTGRGPRRLAQPGLVGTGRDTTPRRPVAQSHGPTSEHHPPFRGHRKAGFVAHNTGRPGTRTPDMTTDTGDAATRDVAARDRLQHFIVEALASHPQRVPRLRPEELGTGILGRRERVGEGGRGFRSHDADHRPQARG